MRSPYNPKSRRGHAVIARYGASTTAANAREGIIRKRLLADGLTVADFTPEEFAAYRQKALAEGAAKARAAKALKQAVRLAEQEAAAQAWAADDAKKKAQAAARRAARAIRKVEVARAAYENRSGAA